MSNTSEDGKMYTQMFGLVFAGLAIALFMSWLTSSDERKYVNKTGNQCTSTKEVTRYDLDKVYCGKACYRYAVEHTYWCAKEKKTVIFVD